jgi:hypothetical protein
VAAAGTGPTQHALTAEQVTDGGDWAHIVELALGVPGGDAGVEDGICHREEESDGLAQIEAVALGDESGELGPVTGRKLGVGAVGPVLGGDLLFRGQVRLDVQHVPGLVQEVVAITEMVLAELTGTLCSEPAVSASAAGVAQARLAVCGEASRR